ncbi:hypothetical protein B0H14DRAFT_2595586 [Mycena olivaceomarginata]|nr:hypothetical protein B0H14DRAFT_2595586 [Mycena olivaceomarginata]
MAKNGQKQQKQAFSWFKIGTDLYYQRLQSGLLIFSPKKIVGQVGNCGFQLSRSIDGRSAIFDSITMLEMSAKYLQNGLHKCKASVLRIFHEWDEIFFPNIDSSLGTHLAILEEL